MKAILRSGFLALAIMLAPTVSVNAGPFEDGLAAAKRGDHEMALRLWQPLAEQGNASAQYNLGVMYHYSHGVPQDDAEAVKWYSMAAEQGHKNAQFVIGLIYALGGWGVPPDRVPAHMWFDIAAAHGHEEAQKQRDILAGFMTPERLAEAQRMAREWMAKHQQ